MDLLGPREAGKIWWIGINSNEVSLCHVHPTPSSVRRASPVRRASVFFTLRRQTQCTMPAQCVATPSLCAAHPTLPSFYSNLLFSFNMTFSCFNLSLLSANKLFLNMTNDLYTENFNFHFIKLTFVMFTLALSFQTLFCLILDFWLDDVLSVCSCREWMAWNFGKGVQGCKWRIITIEKLENYIASIT